MSVSLTDEEFELLAWQGSGFIHLDPERGRTTFNLIVNNTRAIRTATVYSMLNCVSSELRHIRMGSERETLYRDIQGWCVRLLNERNPVHENHR